MIDIQNNLNNKPGIAIDIDDTISDTLRHFIKKVQEKFGNPEHLSADELAKKYGRMIDISYYQTPEIRSWLDEESMKNEAQEAVEVFPGAVEAVQNINQILPVRMYITSRPSIVEEGTRRWLLKNGFPKADIVTREESKIKIDGNAWKAEILERLYPTIVGIVDDNPELVKSLSKNYKGTVFLFDSFGNSKRDKHTEHEIQELSKFLNVQYCQTWQEVINAISREAQQYMV